MAMAKSAPAAAAPAPPPSPAGAPPPASSPPSSRKELLARKRRLQSRLAALDASLRSSSFPSSPPAPASESSPPASAAADGGASASASSSSSAPLLFRRLVPAPKVARDPPAKSDAHWDFLLKEMAWLSADFRSERKRQLSQAKKLGDAALRMRAGRDARRARDRARAEARVRRLASKVGRDVRRGYWRKVERVVEYKQRLEGDANRRKEMDRRLVFLVRKTERYGESLRGDERAGGGGEDGRGGGTTIEEALAQGRGARRRRGSGKGADYSRMEREGTHRRERSFYGERISGNAAGEAEGEEEGYEPDAAEAAAEADEERVAYEALLRSYRAQPKEEAEEEVRKLLEERNEDPEELVRRMVEEWHRAEAEAEAEADASREANATTGAREEAKAEAGASAGAKTEEDAIAETREATTARKKVMNPTEGTAAAAEGSTSIGGEPAAAGARGAKRRRVRFAPSPEGSDGADAILDADDHEEKDEFRLEREELDDETTIEAEEKLGRDMSYGEEIDLLEREGEISIEELRAMYAGMDDTNDADPAGDIDDGDVSDPGDEDGDNPPEVDGAGSPGANAAGRANAMLDEDDHEEENEFRAEREEPDDETTIEAEEKLGRDMSYREEISLLKRESEMSIEDLRAMYAGMQDANNGSGSADEGGGSDDGRAVPPTAAPASLDEDDHEEKDEFHPEAEGMDDEATIDAEEKLGREMSYQEEIDLLKREGEMSIEELRAMYANSEEGSEEGEGSERGGSDVAESDLAGDDDGDIVMEHSADSKRKQSTSNECSDSEHDEDSGGGSPKKRKANNAGTDEGISALESLAASDARARETMLTRPFLLAGWVKLRAYQHVGMNWLVSIQSRRLNGILADEMGLGKTLQTISMLAYLASYKGIWGPHLIVVPTSCLVNWEVEFKRFCPGMKVLCYYGNAKRRKELRTGWTKPNVHHVVITSYQLAVQDAFAFKRKKWYYLILDEAHNIKNFESQRWQTLISFNTQRRLLLTGTPLQNNLMELWSLLHFLMPHVFADRGQFSYWFSNPMDSIIEGNSKRNDDLISRLHGILRPFVLRRLKRDVETQLPGKFEHVVRCRLSRRQMFLYEEFLARSSTRKALKSGGNFMGMMNVLMQLRKVCNHPDLFEPRSVTTPFVMEPLSMSTASCVVNAIEPTSALDRLSPFLMLPLWTMGQGTPSFERSTSFDQVLAWQLCDAMTPESIIVERSRDDDYLTEPMPCTDFSDGLSSFLSRIRSAEHLDRVSRARFIGGINTQRCTSISFPYPDRMWDVVAVGSNLVDFPLRKELTAFQVASTPTELLAMRRSQEERAEDLSEIVDKFIFCVPKAGTKKPVLFSSSTNSASSPSERFLLSKTSTAFEKYFSPFKKAQSRLTMCFPDKKLVQFDAGKLQTLSTLLRKLKQGDHRVLIFTQMSKMLDVLEAFLNLNGHTYLRLDGATDVERRQRLMDRFNNDPKVFCFILSTRSGGLGINLTGADTVIFYDSDWNPAMDAQAQDRAHRIGQTREVHIYRMITENSIEENILTKAKQKRNLDFLVMDEGKFHDSEPDKIAAQDVDGNDDNAFTKDKLQTILGITDDDNDLPKSTPDESAMSKDQLESAMASLEDEDDVKAMNMARREAAEALQEFDESIQYKQDENIPSENKDIEEKKKRPSNASIDSSGSENPKPKQEDASDEEKEMEKEFAQWQRKVGMDETTINESLSPLERHGLQIKEQIDPFYSQYFWAEQQRLAQTTTADDELNIEEIEQRKIEEEQKAFDDGDLLATFPEPESLPRQRQLYIREKARLRSEIMKRRLTGSNWTGKMEEHTGKQFWYNTDTGEALWAKPQVLKMLEAEETARSEGWAALPDIALSKIFEFLIPFPERTSCAVTCHRWRLAANDISFVLHVWPVEQGALVMDENKLGKNHFRTISDAMHAALPGDTIELGDGHYFINDPGLVADKPIKFVGDEHEPAHVILELGGEIVWKSSGGWMEGLTIRRPRIATGVTPSNEILRIESGSRLDMFHCVFDNSGGVGNTVSVGCNAGGRWEKTSINGGSNGKRGLFLEKNSKVELIDVRIGTAYECPFDRLSALILKHILSSIVVRCL
ncbi:hypothetical protein ACHAWF_016776 [Thalassiosira exigua]